MKTHLACPLKSSDKSSGFLPSNRATLRTALSDFAIIGSISRTIKTLVSTVYFQRARDLVFFTCRSDSSSSVIRHKLLACFRVLVVVLVRLRSNWPDYITVKPILEFWTGIRYKDLDSESCPSPKLTFLHAIDCDVVLWIFNEERQRLSVT